MAVVFELVVNFGRNEAAVSEAAELVERHQAVVVRGASVPITSPSITRFRPPGGDIRYIEFSVWPRGINKGGPAHPSFSAYDLKREEIMAVGEQLYELLRRFRGYEVAIVGWDPEELVDVAILEEEWVLDGTISTLNGLVLAQSFADRWQPAGFVPFEPGFQWLPYSGTPKT